MLISPENMSDDVHRDRTLVIHRDRNHDSDYSFEWT